MSRALGLTSVLTAPLSARGELLGLISVGRSGLTNRTQHNYTTADRDLFTAVSKMVADAIDDAVLARPQPSARFQLRPPSALARRPRTLIAYPAPAQRFATWPVSPGALTPHPGPVGGGRHYSEHQPGGRVSGVAVRRTA